ncbi:uncharacterized protein N7496_008076 [Penicillium cataractarum]|uniref:Uncharacterized protein n=1 Tax=Penicillium cataractarum TaxID=2100454 RepID=A0A9W9RY30_9EURO|nr:uncharacterized protein N7496_008076 [Penicillium cataractarum]KAJ5368316.1 hypothetical protein N7496_008076 [Penicillium cataractarum]
MDFTNSGGFPSRRSYPNLNHVSLAPLTPRFPIDDDIEPEDYFNTRHGTTDRDAHDHTASGSRTPPRTSYLSSVSVPSTPPILSHSRSSSRTRHARSKSSTRAGLLSDTNLHSKEVTLALHHHQASHKKQTVSTHARRQFGDASSKSDAEWMLRAGIALASSTREEKGQSWLSKRESSTSLVDMSLDDATTPHPQRHHHRTKSGASSRKSRSGTSTPAAYSRRSSRSRGGSRRGSRAGLTMTTIPPLSSASSTGAGGKAPSPGVGTMSPVSRGRGSGLVPDFVDERIRAEMASLQRERGFSDDESEFWDGEDDSDSEYDSFSDDTPDEFDEADLQRLTRERGFGLGSWIDRLVEWTLFGVEEWPAPAPASATRIGTAATSTIVTFEEGPHVRSEVEERAHDTLSLASAEDDDADALSHTDGESVGSVEKPGTQGGWEDAGWLFRVMKRALI